MTVQEFIQKYNGKTIGYPSGQYVGECLSLVKQYMLETYGFNPPASGCNGARCYWSKFPAPLSKYFTKVPNTPEFVPQEGDIMVWNENAGGGYGHIAICTGNNTGTQYFESFDQNWNGRHAHLVNHNYKNVYGVLRPKGDNVSSELDACMKDRQKFWDERDELYRALNTDSQQGALSSIAGYKSRITDLSNQIGTYKAEVENREEQVGRLQDQVLMLKEDNKLLDIKLKTAIEETNEFAKDKGRLAVDLQKCKTNYESLKAGIGDGTITLTLGQIFEALLNRTITISLKGGKK